MIIIKLLLIFILALSVIFFSVFVFKGLQAKRQKVANSYSKDLPKHSFFLVVSTVVLVERLSEIL